MGSDDGTISSDAPVLIGNLYGLYIEGNDINFYDGILKGQTDGYSGVITGLPRGGLVEDGEETINEVLYQTDTVSAYQNWLMADGQLYNNIQSACEAINGNGTIELVADADTRFIQRFTTGDTDTNNIILDLKGHTLSTTQPIYNQTNLKIIDSSDEQTGKIISTRVTGLINERNANLEIDAGTYKTTVNNAFAIENNGTMKINYAKVEGTNTALKNKGTLTIDDITIEESAIGINTTGGTITINNGNITTSDIGITRDGGTVVINNGTIYGTNYGLGGHGGYVTLNNGLIKSTDNNAIYTYDGIITINGGEVISENNTGILTHWDVYVNDGLVQGTRGIENQIHCNAINECYVKDIEVNDGHIVGTADDGIRSAGGQYVNNGNIRAYGGVIEGQQNGINANSYVKIGKNDKNVSVDSPVIIGHTYYGIAVTNYTEFYDGILKGATDAHYGLISEIPDAYIIEEDYEYLVKDKRYETNYLVEKGNWLEVGGLQYNSINEAVKHVTEQDNKIKVIRDTYVDFQQTISGQIPVEFELDGHSLVMTQPLILGTNTIVNDSIGGGGINNLRDYAIANNSTSTINSGIYHSNVSSTISNSGTLTITGGQYNNETNYGLANSGTATINGGTFNGTTDASAILNSGNLTVNNGTIISDKKYGIASKSGKVIVNGGTITSNENIGLYGEYVWGGSTDLTVNNGTITGNTTGVSHIGNGNFTINGGTIKGQTTNGARFERCTAKINGGIIEGEEYGIYTTTTTTIGEDNGTVSIDSPIIKGELYGLYIYGSPNVDFYDGTIKGITGRHYGVINAIARNSQIYEDTETIDEKEYLTEYLIMEKEIIFNQTKAVRDRELYDSDEAAEAAAKYGNLQTAINEAEAGDNLILIENAPLYYAVSVNKDNLTLDLNGKTISTNKGWQITNPFTLKNTSEQESLMKISTATNLITSSNLLTIDNITLKNNSSSNYVLTSSNKLVANNLKIDSINGIQTTNEAIITNSNINVTNNGITNSGKLTINGGTYKGGTYSIYSNSSKKVEIENVTINGLYYNSGNNSSTLKNSTVNGNISNNTSQLTINTTNVVEGKIANNGTMEIVDSTIEGIEGTAYQNSYYYSDNHAINNTSTMTIKNTNINITESYARRVSSAIYNTGTLNIKDNTYLEIGNDDSESSYNYTYKGIETASRGTTIIDNSEIKVIGGKTNYAIYMNSDNAKTTILTGSIKSLYASTGYAAYIEKGTFEMGHYEGQGVTSEDVSIENPLVYAYGKSRGIGVKKLNGSFNFYDGIIKGSKYAKPETTTNVEHQFEVTTYVEEDTGFEYAVLEWMKNDYQGDTVCLLNEVYYKSVQEAINKVTDDSEIVLLKSIEEDLTIPTGKTVKLNLNKHSITTETINNGTFNVYNGSLQSFENTTVDNRGTLIMGENDGNVSKSNIRIVSEGITIKNNGTLIVYDGYIEGHQALEGKIDAIAQYARIKTEYDEQSEKKYIQSLSPESIINGETDLIITINPNNGVYNDSREIQEVYKKYGETYILDTPTKSGCNFIGWEISEENVYDETTNTITVSMSDITVKALWEVSENAKAKINEEYYLSLQDALNNATKEDTVELLKDTTEDITNKKDTLLDLGGHTVTGAFINQGELKIINGIIDNPNGVGLINRKKLTLGENDGEVQEEYVKVMGTTIGLQQEAIFNFYDGYIEGEVALNGKVDSLPQGYFLYNEHNSIKDCQRTYLIGNPENAVAVIENGGTQYFFSLQDAIDTATITGNEIYIIKDFEATYTVTTKENSDIVINMSGFQMTTGSQITNNGTLKIYDSSETQSTIKNAKTIINNGTLTIENVNITANTSSINTITNNGILNTKNTTIQANSGYSINTGTNGDLRVGENTKLNATNYALYNNQTIPLEITTGEIHCINNAKELILDGDVIIKNYDNDTYGIQYANDNAIVTINNGRIETRSHAIYSYKYHTELTVNDGYIYSSNSYAIYERYNNSDAAYRSYFTFNGGTFSSWSNTIYLTGNEVKINGGTFVTHASDSGYYPIYLSNVMATIKNATIQAERASGIYFQTSFTSSVENCNIYAGSLYANGIRVYEGTINVKNNIINTPRTSANAISLDYSGYGGTRNVTLEGNEIKSGNNGVYINAEYNYTTKVTVKSGNVYGDSYGVYENGAYSNVIIGSELNESIEEPYIEGKLCAFYKTAGTSKYYSGTLVGTSCSYNTEFNEIRKRMEIVEDTIDNELHSNAKTTSSTDSSEIATSMTPKKGDGFARITYLGETTGACENGQVYDFSYKEREDVFNAICPGDYKLEVWGAQGGSYNNSNVFGGYGGYSKGEITLEQNETLYINVGGRGTGSTTNNTTTPGGYNGGGYAKNINNTTFISSGGGATHIATKSGLLKDLENDKDKIIIVAGGGGGSTNSGIGGSGGGYIGKKGMYYYENSNTGCYSTGGTQTEGGYFADDSRYGRGSFGQGGEINLTSNYYSSGGGGGYYGGAATMNYRNGAGGGSGYIANERLKNKEMVGYKVSETSSEKYKATLAEKEAFVQVGEEKFASLNEAIEYIDENYEKTGTVKVIKNAKSTEITTIKSDENITIDLNSKELTTTGIITNNGILTITDQSEDKTGKLINKVTTAFKNVKTLNIEYVTLDCTGKTAIDTTNSSIETYVNISNNTKIIAATGISMSYYNQLTMNDSTINSTGNGINISNRKNNLVINNCNITSTSQIAINQNYNTSSSDIISTIKIDGGTYTGKTYAIYVYASKFEMKNAKAITTSTSIDEYAIYNPSYYGAGYVNLTNVELEALNASGLYIYSQSTINNLKITCKAYGIRHYSYDYTKTITIDNLEITSNKYGIYLETSDYGTTTLNINSGYVYGKEIGINQESSRTTINIGNKTDNFQITSPLIESEGKAVVITRGKVNFYNGKLIGNNKSYTGTFNIIRTGKKLYTYEDVIDDVSKNITYLTDEADFLQVGDDPENTYNSFEDALAEITEETGTIKVLTDNNVYEVLTIPTDKNITLDLNNKNLVFTQTIVNNGTLTITGQEDNGKNVITNNKNEGINNKGTLSLNNITLKTNNSVSIRGTSQTSTITINDSYISGTTGIQLDSAQKAIINNTDINCSNIGVYLYHDDAKADISSTTIFATNHGIQYRGVRNVINISENSKITGRDNGIYQNRSNSYYQSYLTVDSSEITGGNHGIYLNASEITTTNTTIKSNSSSRDYYAAYCSYYSVCNFKDNTLIYAENASGIYSSQYQSNALNIENATVETNVPNGYGIYMYQGTANLKEGSKIIANGYQSYGVSMQYYSSTLNVNGGEIYSKNVGIYSSCDVSETKKININTGKVVGETYGISQTCSKVTTTIGNINNEVSITNPYVEGGLISINKTAGILNFYSGLLKGSIRGNPGTVDAVRTGYEIFEDNDEIQLYIRNKKTLSTTESSETPTANTAKIGNGYARITYEKYEEDNDNSTTIEEITGTDYTSAIENPIATYNYSYTGDVQEFTAPETGEYMIEAWGAQGGNITSSSVVGGKGAYTSGTIQLEKNEKLYIYVGEHYNDYKNEMSFNGGGKGSYSTNNEKNANGGGATDIRLTNGNWNNEQSLASRIMVASGGGGANYWGNSANGGYGGALTGGDGILSGSGTLVPSKGATQTSGGLGYANSTGTFQGKFGIGGYSETYSGEWFYHAGGGGGYYGGGAGGAASGIVSSAAGGSSYISGYTGSVAIKSANEVVPRNDINGRKCKNDTKDVTCSYHYSGKTFQNTTMKAGNEQIKEPNGSISRGHEGNGYVRIKHLTTSNEDTNNYTIKLVTNHGTIQTPEISHEKNTALGIIPSPTIDTETMEFIGWYLDKKYTKKVTENTIVKSDTTLYAKVSYKQSYCEGLENTTTSDFNYTGAEQIYNVLCPGKYKLEAWGAQGGSTTYNSNSNTSGYGGYTVGHTILTTDDKLYINVGGKGNGVVYQQSSRVYTFDSSTGYNGGGYATVYINNGSHAGGGGATHIATNSGLLKNLSNSKDSILIVAGGGGGSSTYYDYPNYSGNGGSGGGATGGSGQRSSDTCYQYGTGGTQNSVGTYTACPTNGTTSRGDTKPSAAGFGLGSNYTANSEYATYGGGGGGYYGGESAWQGPGGGGSGYTSPTKVTDQEMYGYNLNDQYTEENGSIAYLVEKNDLIINTTTNEKFINIQTAINDAENNETLEFIGDDLISYDITIPTGKIITIDMNGHSLVTSKQITNNGELNLINSNTQVKSEIKNNASVTLIMNNYKLTMDGIKITAQNGIESSTNSVLTIDNSIFDCRGTAIKNIGKMTISDSTVYGSTYGIYSNSTRDEFITHTTLNSSQNAYYKYNNGETTITDSTIKSTINNVRSGQPLEVKNSTITSYIRNTGTSVYKNNTINRTFTTYDSQEMINNSGILTLQENSIYIKTTYAGSSGYTTTTVYNSGTLTTTDNEYTSIYDYNNQGTYTTRYRYLYQIQNYGLLTSTSDEFTTTGGRWMYTIYNNSSNNSTVTGATITQSYGQYDSYGIYNYTGNLNVSNTTIDNSRTNNLYGLYMYNSGNVKFSNVITTLHDSTSGSSNKSYGAYIENGEFILEDGSINMTNIENAYGIYLNSANATYTQGVYDGRGTDAADVSTTNPLISVVGTTSGIGVRMGDGTFNYYDGKIIASTSPRVSGDIISKTEKNYQVITKTDEETGYNYCILEYNK